MGTNKKYIYLALIFFSLAAIGIVFYKGTKHDVEIMPLKERKGELANNADWPRTKETINKLIETVRNNPKDTKSRLLLSQAYIQEGRITGDHAYYDLAAMKIVNSILTKNPNDFEALCLKSMIYLSQHHFQEGLETAQQAQKLFDFNSFVYGLLVDANVELGNYEAAVAAADKMGSIRPDLTSYSRISYLREIYGKGTDLGEDGAIKAMQMAVQAGYPGLEQTEWCRVQLGKLYENIGDLKDAEFQYKIALEQRPDYPYALAGLGRLAIAQKNYPEGIKYMEHANNLLADFTMGDELAELYTLNNEPKKAEAITKTLIDKLNGDAEQANSNDQIGHYADKELAYAYLKTKDYDNALKHALIEYNRRPKNIDVNECMAWVKYKRGDYKEAAEYMNVATRMGTQNSVLLCRAGLIKIKNGDKNGGMALVNKARQMNPYLSPELTGEADKLVALK